MNRSTIIETGLKKYDMCCHQKGLFFLRSVMAGGYLGVATILSTTLGALLMDQNLVLSKFAMAASFGIGLVLIVMLGSELFTGNCFITMFLVYHRKVKLYHLLPMWSVCYLGNFIGIAVVCGLFLLSGSNAIEVHKYMASLMNAKLSFDWMQLMIKAILCNFIVCIAAYAGMKIQDDMTKLCIMVIVVMAFVLPGFEHSIANMGSFMMGAIALGNTQDWSLIPMHMLISTIGNMLGGGVLFALPLYLSMKE